MKKNKLFVLILITFLLVGSLVLFTSCNGEEEGPTGGSGYTVSFVSTPSYGALTVQLGPVSIGTGTRVPQGTDLVLTAVPNDNCKFEKFVIDGTDYTGNATMTYTMPAKNITIAAVFSAMDANEFIITFAADPAAGGYFTDVNGTAITSMTAKTSTAANFKVVENQDFTLSGVKYKLSAGGSDLGDVIETDGVYSITRITNMNITITAYFDEVIYPKDITLTSVPSAGGTITANKPIIGVEADEKIDITATPDDGNGYGFIRFQVDGVDVYPENVTSNANGTFTFTLTMPARDVEVRAVYGFNVTINYYEGNIVKRPVAVGSAFQKPDDPLRGLHTFNNWFNDATSGSIISFPLTINAPVTIYARWDRMSLIREDYDIFVHDLSEWNGDGYLAKISYQEFQSQAESIPGARMLMFINPRNRTPEQSLFRINPYDPAPTVVVLTSDLTPIPAGLTLENVLPPTEELIGTQGVKGESWQNQAALRDQGMDAMIERNKIVAGDFNNVQILDIMNTEHWRGWTYFAENKRDHELLAITIIRMETWVPKQ